MTTIENSILINAPIEKIWKELATVDRLDKFDPSSKKSSVLSDNNYGYGAKRRVEMKDGKNWFEEKCTVFKENEDLKYELTACSFPVHNLNHRYSFRKLGNNQFEVTQMQSYTMKYGLLGKVMGLMLRPKWNNGVKMFLSGLKEVSEK